MNYELLAGFILIALTIVGEAIYLRRHPDVEAKLMAGKPAAAQESLDKLQAALPTRADVDKAVASAVASMQSGVGMVAAKIDAANGMQTVPVDHVVLDPITAGQGAGIIVSYVKALADGVPLSNAPTMTPNELALLLATLGGPNARAVVDQYAAWYAAHTPKG